MSEWDLQKGMFTCWSNTWH